MTKNSENKIIVYLKVQRNQFSCAISTQKGAIKTQFNSAYHLQITISLKNNKRLEKSTQL